MRQPWRDRFKITHRCLRLLAQWRGKRGDPGEEVLTFLLPAELDDLIVLGLEHRSQIARDVVIEIEPGLGIRTPGVLNLQKQMTQQRDVCRITHDKLSLSQPVLAQPRDLAVPGELQRVAGDAVDPGVSDLAGDYR